TLREADALCVVLRAFGADARPAAELREVEADLLIADLAVVESALENATKRRQGKTAGSAGEVEALQRAHATLSEERPLRDAALDEEHRKVLRGLAPLTLKPRVVVANLEEGHPIPEGLPEGTLGAWAATQPQ